MLASMNADPCKQLNQKPFNCLNNREPYLHELFWMLPPRLFIRGSTGGGVKHIVFGANPRGGCLAIATLKFPAVVQVFTKFLRTVCPRHLFTTFVLREGCFGKPHKDRKNSEDFVLLALLSEFVAGSGLWIESPGGTVSLDNKGSPAFGKVVDISKPFRFDSRNTLHAGFIPPGTDASKRVILVAFCTKFPDDLNTQLLNLGFNLPNACRTPACNPVPRIIQLLQSPAPPHSVSAGSEEDVVEVWDVVSITSSLSSTTQQLNVLQAPSDPNTQDHDTQATEDTALDTQQDIPTQKEESCE